MRCTFLVLLLFGLLEGCIGDDNKHVSQFDLRGKVVHLKDGDSFVVLDKNKEQVEVRLVDIDAPELHQAYGRKAKQYLSKLIKGKMIGINYVKKDRYNRVLGEVYINDLFINLEMIRAGYAWHFTRFSDDKTMREAEELARQDKRGLWQGKDPKAPWKWRAQH